MFVNSYKKKKTLEGYIQNSWFWQELEKISHFLIYLFLKVFYDELEIVVFKKLNWKFIYAIQPYNFTSKNIYKGNNQRGIIMDCSIICDSKKNNSILCWMVRLWNSRFI